MAECDQIQKSYDDELQRPALPPVMQQNLRDPSTRQALAILEMSMMSLEFRMLQNAVHG